MAVCILGALAVSSCSKDEFFGLEDSEVLDYSAKYEIAMSQEFTDYAKACFSFVEAFDQPIDTANMQKVDVEGKQVYVVSGMASQKDNAVELLQKIKTAFPKLAMADKIDFDEIMDIALSENQALSDIASIVLSPSTKSYENRPMARQWLNSADQEYWNYSGDRNLSYSYMEGCTFYSHNTVWGAVQSAIWDLNEYSGNYGAGGFIWGDNSAVSMRTVFGEYWPDVAHYGSPSPEIDFVILPNAENLYQGELSEMFGGEYFTSGRIHYAFDYNGNYQALPF